MSVKTQAIIERPATPDDLEKAGPGDQCVLLRNISWETYEKLIDEITDQPGLRIAYHNFATQTGEERGRA